jgi:hypothetical protein
MLNGAREVLDAWGFEPITILTWANDKIGTGAWLRGQTEDCILATRGKPLVNLRGCRMKKPKIKRKRANKQRCERRRAASKMLVALTHDTKLPGTITPMSLTLPKGMPLAQWQTVGHALAGLATLVAWWVGDWWAYGERAYGDRAEAVREGIFDGQYMFGTLRNLGWVRRSVEASCRHDVLTFAHHQAVAALSPAIQRVLLERAEEEGLTAAQLRAIVRRYGNGGKLPKVSDGELAASAANAEQPSIAGCRDRAGYGFPLPSITSESLRAGLGVAVNMLAGLSDKPMEKFIGASVAPDRLREVAGFFDRHRRRYRRQNDPPLTRHERRSAAAE